MVTDEEWEQIVTPAPLTMLWGWKKSTSADLFLKFMGCRNSVRLWRPYHEMNGTVLYGNRPGRKGIQKLWKMMYDRYCKIIII